MQPQDCIDQIKNTKLAMSKLLKEIKNKDPELAELLLDIHSLDTEHLDLKQDFFTRIEAMRENTDCVGELSFEYAKLNKVMRDCFGTEKGNRLLNLFGFFCDFSFYLHKDETN